MKKTLVLITLVAAISFVASGCSGIGEQTAPKPDPSQFLPKDKAGGPPPSSPTSK